MSSGFFGQIKRSFTKMVGGNPARFSNNTWSGAYQSDGKVLIGGTFQNYGAVAGRNRLIRLNSDGTLDTTFCANAVDGTRFSLTIYSIAIQSDGKILVGGGFSNYAGTAGRNYLIRLNSDGTLDTAFCNNAVDGGKFSSIVYSVTVQPDGKILVGGAFNDYGGVVGRRRLVRLNSDGTLDTAFTANASDGAKFNGTIEKAFLQPDGKIIVCGSITNYAGVSGRNRLIRLNSDGTLDAAFTANASDGTKFSNSVLSVGIQSDGKVLACGSFTNYGGVASRDRFVRLNADGTVDTAFCNTAVDGTKFGNQLNSVMVQPDGKVVIGGAFVNYGGVTGRDKVIRLTSSGSLDTSFIANASDGAKFNGSCYLLSYQIDGKIVVGGNLLNYAGKGGRSYAVRINSDGTTDNNFCSNASDGGKFSNIVQSLSIDSNNKVLAGGSFTNYGGVTGRNYLTRFNSDGTVDTDFCANASDGAKFDGAVIATATQPDGKVLAGGLFSNYGSTTSRAKLTRLNADGTVDAAFCANAVDGAKFNGTVNAIFVQPDGKILVGGNFIDYAGVTGRNYLVRLNSDGTLDTAFMANAVDGGKFTNIVQSISYQADDKILVGGSFSSYAGLSGRNYLTRLNSNGTLDSSFTSVAVDGSKFNGSVNTIAVQADGKILAGGAFTNYGGASGRNNLIRLNDNGSLDATFCSNAVDGAKFNGLVVSVSVDYQGKIVVGGSFSAYGSATGRNYLVKLNSDGTLDTTFMTRAVDGAKFNGVIRSVGTRSDGKVVVSGDFTLYINPGYPDLPPSFAQLYQDGYVM